MRHAAAAARGSSSSAAAATKTTTSTLCLRCLARLTTSATTTATTISATSAPPFWTVRAAFSSAPAISYPQTATSSSSSGGGGGSNDSSGSTIGSAGGSGSVTAGKTDVDASRPQQQQQQQQQPQRGTKPVRWRSLFVHGHEDRKVRLHHASLATPALGNPVDLVVLRTAARENKLAQDAKAQAKRAVERAVAATRESTATEAAAAAAAPAASADDDSQHQDPHQVRRRGSRQDQREDVRRDPHQDPRQDPRQEQRQEQRQDLHQRQRQQRKHEPLLSAEQLVSSVQAGPSRLDADAVRAELDALRPPRAGNGVLAVEDYEALARKIDEGFTNAQLLGYMRQKREADAAIAAGAAATAASLETTAATAGTSPDETLHHRRPSRAASKTSQDGGSGAGSTFAGAVWKAGLVGPDSQRSPKRYQELVRGKERTVARLLEQHWRLRRADDASLVGQLELRLTPLELSLLLSDERSILKEASRMHQARIDAAPVSGVIQVTASEENAYSVASDVKVALQRIQRMALDLRPVRAMLPDDESRRYLTHEAALKSIARVTGVAIELQDGGDTLVIHALGPDMKAAENARRLLLSHLTWPTNSCYDLICEKASSSNTVVLWPTENPERLPWLERSRSWARLRMTVARDASGVVQPVSLREAETNGEHERHILAQLAEDRLGALAVPQLSAGVVPNLLDMPQQGAGDAQTAEEAGSAPTEIDWWAAQPRVSVDAVVAHILHDCTALPVISPAPLQHQLQQLGRSKQQSARAVSFDIPGLIRGVSSALDTYGGDGTKQREENILLRFAPSPWNAFGAEVAAALPAVEIVLGVDSAARRNRLVSVEAVQSQCVCDVLLPSRPADMRLVRRAAFAMVNPALMPAVAAFLARSRLALWAEGRLEAAPSLRLPIPGRMVLLGRALAGTVPASEAEVMSTAETATTGAGEQQQQLERDAAPASAAAVSAASATRNGFVDVEYLFSGLEFRHTNHLALNGWKARYASVEGGTTGGRRGELRFSMEQLADTVPPGTQLGEVDAPSNSSSSSSSSSNSHANRINDKNDDDDDDGNDDDNTLRARAQGASRPGFRDFFATVHEFVSRFDQRVVSGLFTRPKPVGEAAEAAPAPSSEPGPTPTPKPTPTPSPTSGSTPMPTPTPTPTPAN